MMRTVKALVNCISRVIRPKLSIDIIMNLLLTNVNGKLFPYCPDTPLCDAAKRIYFLFKLIDQIVLLSLSSFQTRFVI